MFRSLGHCTIANHDRANDFIKPWHGLVTMGLAAEPPMGEPWRSQGTRKIPEGAQGFLDADWECDRAVKSHLCRLKFQR
jgi:hypothetical protein